MVCTQLKPRLIFGRCIDILIQNCIGTRKMGRLSSQITESDLEYAVNWYLSLENIHAANDRIVKTMDKMELPNIYHRSQDKLPYSQ